MSDDVQHERPPGGGSYIRRKDGSLLRQDAAVTTTKDAEAPAAGKRTKGK
jgi:hypothetical protein